MAQKRDYLADLEIGRLYKFRHASSTKEWTTATLPVWNMVSSDKTLSGRITNGNIFTLVEVVRDAYDRYSKIVLLDGTIGWVALVDSEFGELDDETTKPRKGKKSKKVP